MKGRLAAVAVALLLLAAAPAEEAIDLLFEQPHWAEAAPGAALSYRYARKVADAGLYGPAFEDRIRLTLAAGTKPEERTVAVGMFSGEQRRAAGPFEDVTTNPVLTLFLENHVQTLSKLLGANPRYLKNAIRTALRERADVERSEIDMGGRVMPVRIVSVEPFLEDANKARMRGLDRLAYTFAVAEGLPGRIAEIRARAAQDDGTVRLEEVLVYDPKGD